MPLPGNALRPDPPEADCPAGRTPRRGRGGLTLLDVANALGVSRTTVSNAYNRPDKLSATLREEILGRARELGYFGPDPTRPRVRCAGASWPRWAWSSTTTCPTP